MTPSDDLLELLQDDLLARLAMDSYFEDVKLISQQDGDLDKEVELVLAGRTKKAGKSGACVILHSVDIAESTPELPSPELFLEATFECTEHHKLNRSSLGTGKGAAALVSNVTRCIQHYMPSHLSLGGAWYLRGTGQLSLAKDQSGYVVIFRIPAYFPQGTKVSDVQAAVDGFNLVLTTATSAATIRYSTDSKGPAAAAGSISTYSAPVALTPGEHSITVWAVKTGSTPSNVITYTVTISAP